MCTMNTETTITSTSNVWNCWSCGQTAPHDADEDRCVRCVNVRKDKELAVMFAKVVDHNDTHRDSHASIAHGKWGPYIKITHC